MQLLELTPAEIAYLKAPPAVSDGLQTRLARRLAATLTARLRLPVRAIAQSAAAPADAPATPSWQPDDALATLWLTRRLGGQRAVGTATFVPPTLLHTLDATLAECWLDVAGQGVLPHALAWHISAGLTQATLTVQLPRHINDMTRWARGVIRHGE
jgi:hypothetical protein